MVWFGTCVYRCVTLPVASTPLPAAAQVMAMPARTVAPGKPAAALSAKSQESGAGEVGKSDTVPASRQANKDVPSAFNQMVAQIVAEATVPETAPRPAVSVPAAPAQTVKLPPKSTAAPANQLPDLPAPAWTAPVTPNYTVSIPAAPVAGRRQDTRAATSTNENAAQRPVAPTDVNVPILIEPKPQLPPYAGGGDSTGRQPVKTAAVSSAEEPAAITLQPKPVLEVKIHLNQPVTEPLLIAKETNPAAQSPVAHPAANQVANQAAIQIVNPVVSAYPAKPTIANPVVVATSSVPASIPAVVVSSVPAAPFVAPPVIAAPVATAPVVTAPAVPTVAPPVVAVPAVAMPAVAMPVAAAPVVTAPVVAAPVVAAPVVAVPVVAAPTAPAPAPVDDQLSTQAAQEPAARKQNSERGAPDPGDADTGPVTAANEPAVPRILSNQTPVIAQPQKADGGSTQSSAQGVAPSVVAPAGAVPVVPTAAPAPMTATEAKPESQAAGAPLREESLGDRTKTQQPLRSLALEFTPDGAGDIKVRLSERAGDVHISLHGTDPSLAGRVREGVGDLVGSLSKAGYDAEAWTPGQGRQNQQQASDQRKAPPSKSSATDAEEFNGILQQPLQEIS